MDKIGWKNVTLKDIAEWGSGGTPKSTVFQYYGGEIPWLTIGDLNDGYITNSNNTITEEGLKNSSARLIDPGSVLVAMYGSIGKLGINRVPLTTNQAIAFTQKLHSFVHNRYLFFYLLHIRLALYKLGKGGTQRNISQTVLKKVEFPLAPLHEQRAIVAKIEQLFSDLDYGIANLKKAQEQLKIYRQAVLKKAFEGELTRKWRAEQTDLPSAEELLLQIKEEREKQYQKQLDEWKKAVKEWEDNGKDGKKPSRPKKPTEVLPLAEEESVELPELPEGNFWLKLGMLTLNVEYGTSAKSKKEGKVPVLRMGNIQNNCFVWNDLVYTDNKDEINKYLLKKGDVLFNRTNSPELVGKTAIYNGEKTAIFAGYLIRINQIHRLVNSNYLNCFLNSYTAKVHGNTVKTDGVNQSNINGEKLKNYPFPYFSLLEQSKIVREIETRLSVCDKLEATIAESLQKSEALRQSILKRAFEGKLLSEKELEEARNAPDWEPADKLLERIKTEKEKTGNKKSFSGTPSK